MKDRFGDPDITEAFERFGSKIKRSVWLDTGRHLRVSGNWVEASKFCAGVIVDFRNKPYRQRPKN